MDDEDEGDWIPPPTPPIIESEVFQIPSGLPSLMDYVRIELEAEAAEAAAAAAAAAAEAGEGEEGEGEGEEQAAEAAAEGVAEEGSFIDHGAAGDEEAAAAPEEAEDDYDMPAPEVKATKKPKKKTGDDWYEMDVKIDFDDFKAQMERQAKEELRLRLIESTHDYLEQLFNRIVEQCEYEDPDEILRTRLNKKKLCRELDDKMFQLDVEQKVRMFLNRKTVEYFRRKKATRPLIDDSPENILNELRKYREGLLMLNKHRGREAATKALVDEKVGNLKKTVAELEIKAKESCYRFAQMMKRIFGQEGSDKMESVIDICLSKMRSMRKEISNVRFVLIQRQHTMAMLQNKAKKLEDLGNGLRMADFEHLQTETQALGKKLEERHNELNRLHARCDADIHTLAHIREKQHMLRNTIAAQQTAYDELIEEKQYVREYLNSLKMDRGSIRREFQKISFQGGLLDKPELLIDYDIASDKREVLRGRIAELKAAQAIIDYKLKHMMRALQ